VISKLNALKIEGYRFVASIKTIYTLVDDVMLIWPLKHFLDSKASNSHLSLCVSSVKPFR